VPALSLVAGFGFGACGSNGGGPAASTGTQHCTSACAKCGSDFCVDCAGTGARYRDEFESALYSCVIDGGDAACDTLWQSCAIQAESALTPRAIDTSYRDDCLAKRTDCEAQGVSFADDDCLLSVLLEQSVVTQAQACLSKTCTETPSCLSTYFQ
jgi:hypothetical protein